MSSAAADPINATFSVTATFSEATSDFTDADISVTNGSVSNFNGSGTTYTFDVTPTSDGAVDVDIASGVATDAAGNVNAAATTLSRAFDATAPTVTLTSAAADPINSTFSVTATFSEATSDFTATDISVTNGSVSNLAGSGTTYTFDVTPTADGAVDVDIASGVATDAAGNGNTAATTLSRTFDETAPTVSTVTPNLTSILDSNAGTGTFTLTVDFSEAMNTSVAPTLTFPVEDPTNTLTLNTGNWSDSDTYIATYDIVDANETVSDIDVQVSGAQDTAGNPQTVSTQTDRFSINTASSVEFASPTFTSDESIGTSNAVTLIRSGDISSTASVQIDIAGGTATGSDYTSSSFPVTVTFDPSDTTQTVAIPITDDLIAEEDETILLSITGASNAIVGSQSNATLTIADNETAGFSIDKSDITVSEAGTTEALTLTLDFEPSSDVVFNIASSDEGEATVAPTTVTLNSTNWDTGVEVVVTGVNDTEIDGDQTSTLTISVDADESDDVFDGLSERTVNITTTDTTTNDAPTVSNTLSKQTTETNTSFSYSLPTNTFADADLGDPLTLSADQLNGDALPTWLTFDGSRFSGTATASDVSIYYLQVTATDSRGASVSTPFALNVNPSRTVAGTPGNIDETVNGTQGAEELRGFDGNDILRGQGGNDKLNGGRGDDLLIGNGGDDILIGQAGSDTLVGGTGSDLYVLQQNKGKDTVQGFAINSDKIVLGALSFSDIRIGTTGDGNSTNIIIRSTNEKAMVIEDFQSSWLTESDFMSLG